MEFSDSYPFLLHWVWGHQTCVPPINLSIHGRKEIFYAAGSVGICYDCINNKQYLMLGHKNDIIAIAASPDRKFLVSADSGDENVLIIWHADTRHIYHVISGYFPPEGIISIRFSPEGDQLLTLSRGHPQKLCIWNWKLKNMFPDLIYEYKENAEYQHYVTFHPVFSSHFASCGNKSVHFFLNDNDEVKSSVLNIRDVYDEKMSNQMGNFTETAFSQVSSLAFTATTKGKIVLWGRSLYSSEKPTRDSVEWLVMNPGQRVCIRMIQATESKYAISFLKSVGNYILAGTGKCELIYYDESLCIHWSKCFGEGHINNVSFLYRPKRGIRGAVRKIHGKAQGTQDLLDCPFEATDFILSTVEGYVGYYSVATKELTQILWGTNHLIKSVAVHPLWSYVYFGDYNGNLQKWNYSSKQLLNQDVYQSACSEIEIIDIDKKGAYAACIMSNGNLVIFDAVCFSSKPFFTADEVINKPTMLQFSPDSQHLLITDVSSYITHYRLQFLFVPELYHLMHKDKVPPDESFWVYAGKTRQHQSRIVDNMFNHPEENEPVFFYTLGEDRFLVQYNITNSKGLDMEVSKRIVLERRPIPTCMVWYPIYDVSKLIAVLNDDGKMRVYSLETEQVVRIVSLPVFEEPIKRIMFQSKLKYLLEKEFPQYTNIKDVFQYFVFNCSHMIGLSKFPIDGNPNISLGVTSTPSGINYIVPNKTQTFLFTTGLNDKWIFMYEINILPILEAEREGGEGIDAFKYLFPSNSDPDEMKNKLIYSLYALELEMKMLKLGNEEHPALTGEVPIRFLEYVLAALGCFVSPKDLQPMLRDIEFESKYLYNGQKETLSCLDIMKLYVNYRPADPVTKNKLKKSFHDILVLEENPDQFSRARFIDILSTRGDVLSSNELLKILKCLKNIEVTEKEFEDSSLEDKTALKDEDITTTVEEMEADAKGLKELIPEYVTEDVFLHDIVCLESSEEDMSKYVLKQEDYTRVQEYPTLQDFIAALPDN